MDELQNARLDAMHDHNRMADEFDRPTRAEAEAETAEQNDLLERVRARRARHDDHIPAPTDRQAITLAALVGKSRGRE